MRKTTKAAIAAAVAAVLSGGVAGATGNLPTQADSGLSTASDHSGIDVPVSSDDHPTQSDDTSNDSVESESQDPSSNSQPDNHGAAVSDVAKNTDATGADKGAAVSAVARDNTGLNDHAADQATTGASNADGHRP